MKTNEANIIYYQHFAGCKIAKTQADATIEQDVFLQMMAAEDINMIQNRNVEIRSLCKSQGVRFHKTYDRFNNTGSLRSAFKERQRAYIESKRLE